ncbi:eCIS core domain-containing protein [Polluticoccus soli]|uniref:eCIS core domain-containing protein n=1 Tax=Polluticoccus soli TaxID=3034150 RepID=UPI0023E26215|nr:DUF4157 domain-containing protein [Flavipsychrobacter sp. JY13-12]
MLTAAAKISKPASKNTVQRKAQPAVSAPSRISFLGNNNSLQLKPELSNTFVNANNTITTLSAQPSRQTIIQPKVNEHFVRPIVQTKIEIGAPNDRYEQEADSVAEKVVTTPDSAVTVSAPTSTGIKRKTAHPGIVYPMRISRIAMKRVQCQRTRKVTTNTPAARPLNIEAKLNSTAGRGSPMDAKTRAFMEPRFGADFSGVRIHTDRTAAQMNNALGSYAFAYNNNIYFNQGQYQPGTTGGKRLLAHELTHVVQQGAAIQRSSIPQISQRPPPGPAIQGLGIQDVLDYFADKANNIPGFALLTFIIGVNPINWRDVPRTPINLFRGIIGLIPGGNLIFEALQNHGILDRVGNWMMGKFSELGMAASLFGDAIDRFIDSLSWTDIFDLGDVWNRAKRIFTEPIDRIISFITSLVRDIIVFIKDAILRPLASLAEGTRGYDLLKAVLGQDPITGDPVPRTADTLIGGFMKLIGQEEIWENIKKGNAIPRAWAWFQGALSGLLGFVRQIPTLFVRALTSLELMDIVLVPRAFAKIAGVFGSFIMDFMRWAGNTVWDLLEILFSVVAPGAMPYLRRAAGAFRSILANPIGFIGNLVRAGIMGFRQFASRFLSHLRNSLIQWITGALSGANIYIPQSLTVMEIIKFVLSVLGLTWQNIRQKLVRAVGERVVMAMEATFDIVKTLITQGPAAAWEKIQEAISNLQQMVMQGIMEFVSTRIVQAAITRLLTSLNPAGAFIQAIIAIYNTIMFFIERLRQITQVAVAFMNSIMAIASGNLAAAANRVEQTMAGMLTLVISFLARLVGLGRVSDAITNVINRIRQPIDRALDRVIDWIISTARRLGRFVVQSVAGWLGLRKQLRSTDGVQHTLYFAGSPPRLMIATTPMPVRDYITGIKRDNNLTDAQVGPSLQVVGQIEAKQAENHVDENKKAQQVNEINTLLVDLAMKMAVIPLGPSTANSGHLFGGLHGEWGTSATVIFKQKPFDRGSEPAVNSPNFSYINVRKDGSGSYYVKGHLLNDNLGGPGNTWANLTPINRDANKNHQLNFEDAVKTAVNGSPARGAATSSGPRFGYMKSFSVTVAVGRGVPMSLRILRGETDKEASDIPGWQSGWDIQEVTDLLTAEQYVPNSLRCSATVKGASGGEQSVSSGVTNDIGYGDMTKYQLGLRPKTPVVLANLFNDNANNDNERAAPFMALTGIGKVRALNIFDALMNKGRITNGIADIGILMTTLNKQNPGKLISSGVVPDDKRNKAKTKRNNR